MLGWDVSIKRPVARLTGPSDSRFVRGSPAKYPELENRIERQIGETVSLACWECGVYGLRWLTPPESCGDCVTITGPGYPTLLVVRAGAIRGAVAENVKEWSGPPEVRPAFECNQALGPKVADCSDDEWLLVEAWDLS